MEDPVSPGAESLWDADSDATSELSDIYGDLDDLAAGNAEAENVDDADIFQELIGIAEEEKQLSSSRTSSKARENSVLQDGVSSQNQGKEDCHNEQPTNKLIDGKPMPASDSNALGHNSSQTEDYARKEVKSKTLVNNSVSVCESEENEVQDGSSVNTQKKAKKKQARDCTRKSVESHSKKKSKSHHIKHEAIQIKKEKETDSLNDNPTALQLSASLNKDLQFVLSRVIKNSKHPLESRENDLSAKNNDVSKDQHSLTKDGKNESDQSLSSSREKTPSSQGDYKSAASEDKVEGKGKVLEVQEGNPSDGKNVRKVATVAEESHTPPRSVPVSVASSDVVQNIMMMAQVSKRSTAADYMNVGHASTTSKTKSYRIPKKTKKETENNQLDLFEDFLVGQDRDELLREIKKLKTEHEQLQESLHSSQQRCLGLEKDNETLLNNMSSLWKTSVSQLRQKTTEVTTLKREKEAIIFRRALRQVPKDELDRVVSHIAAYNKDELKDFVNSLNEEKEEMRECTCSRGTRTPGRTESVGQRVRQATRGVRLSPSSDSEAMTLKNLLGKKGETVTHSEEKLKTWSKTRASFKSQKCLFSREEEGREDARSKHEMTKSIWNRLGRNDLDKRRTDIENERNRNIAEEKDENRSRGSRKSVFSRLGIRRTITNEEENVNASTDIHPQDECSDVKRGLSKDAVPDTQTPPVRKMLRVKKAVELNDECMDKKRPIEEPQDESVKDRISSSFQVCSSSESADAPHTTTMKQESLPAHLSKDSAPPAKQSRDEAGVPSNFEEDMLSKTLFGLRMKNKLKKVGKPHPPIEQEQTLSSPSGPDVHKTMPKTPVETTPAHRHTGSQEKTKTAATTSLPDNVRKAISAESKAQSEDKVTSKSDEGEIKQDLDGNDKQTDGPSLEKDTKRLKKKQSSVNKENSDKEKESKLTKTIREHCQEIQEDNVKQVEKSYSKGQVQSADDDDDDDVTKNATELDNEIKASEWKDIDSKEMDGAILCLAKLRSIFNSKGNNIRSKKQEKNKHLWSLFGDEDLSEDDDKLIDIEESKEDQGFEIHGGISESLETPNDRHTERKLENKDKNVDCGKKVTDLHIKVKNVQKLQMNNVQVGDCENTLKQGLNSDHEGDSEDTDAVTVKEYPKRRESRKTAHQTQRSGDGSEKVKQKSVRKEKKRKSLKNASEVDVQTESKSGDTSQTTLGSVEDSSSVCEVKHGKHQTKDRTKKVKPEARKRKDLDTQNMEDQTKEKTNSEKKNESKKTSLDMRQKSGKSEQETNSEERQDAIPLTQNTDERKGMTTSRENTKKKPASDETNDKEISSDTTERGSLQQKENDGRMPTRTPTPVLDEEIRSSGDEDEDVGFDILDKSSVQNLGMENVLIEHEALDDTKQQEQSDGKQVRDAKGEKKIKNIPKNNPDESVKEKRTSLIQNKEVGEGDGTDITHSRNDKCQAHVRKEREVAPQDSMSSIDDQDNDNDILQSLLGTNYNEDGLFLLEEELLYEDGCEKEDEEEEEERNSVHDQKLKYGSNSKNDHKESRVEKERKLKKQTESKELNEKTQRVRDLETKVNTTESTSSPRRSARERGRDTPKTKLHGNNGGLDDTDTATKSVNRQSRRDAHTPKTGEKEYCSRSPSHSPSPQKGSLLKPAGGRIRKLFSSSSSRRQQGNEEGVSPLMAREERLHNKRTKKQEPQSKRGERQEPQSKRVERQEQQSKRMERQESHKRTEKQELQSRKGERQESKHSKDQSSNLGPKDKDRRKNAEEHSRKRESHSPNVLSSQNRKSPPRLRKSRKRERSESEVCGKKDWSPRKKGERSSPRKREPREDKEEPASKKRRVSVKSRLTLPPNSDEENMTRPPRWHPSTPETERTRRTSSKLKNQPHIADELMREPDWQGRAHHASKTPEPQKKSVSSVPVDSKLLRSILTQSPSKYVEQDSEKEEGELDEDEEEGEEKDVYIGKPVKNHKKNKCNTVNKNDDIKRQPLKQKEHNSNMEDKEEILQTKELKASKHNACVDSRDKLAGKSCETDKPDISLDTDKEHYEQKKTASKIVISDRTLDNEISPEKAQYTACGIEEQNNPRSSKKGGKSEKQQYGQTQSSPPRMTSPAQDAVQHQGTKTRRNRRRTLEYPSENRKKDQDHNRENCSAVDDNATFFPGDMFQLMHPKVKSHLPPDLSVSSISSMSDDTIDLMVKQHNENFPCDITNGSDDSETSLLKYIADSEDDGCDDNEIHEAKERRKNLNYVINSDNDSCDEDEVNNEKFKRTQLKNLHNLETKEKALNSNTQISKRKTQLMNKTEQVSPHDKVLGGKEHSMITEHSDVAMQTHKEVTTEVREKTSQQYHKDTSESRSPVRCGSESALSYSSTSSESKSPFKCDSQNVSSSSSASSESKSPVKCESQNISSSSNTSDSSTGTERQDAPLHPAVCTTHPSNTEQKDIRDTAICQTNTNEADMDEQDQLSSSDNEEDSELDIENTGSETDEHTERVVENNCGITSSNDQYFTREHKDDAVEDLPSETKPITESEANKSDDSDSDSDCECSECNNSSSSSSSSSGSSSSSSSSDSSSDSEMEDAALDRVKDLDNALSGAEKNSESVDHVASVLQSCDQESSEAVMGATSETASPIKLVSPTKLGCKTPKKTPRKTSSRTHMTELSESSSTMGAFKKTPRKSPCKKSPCKKSVSKDDQSRTPKAKRLHASPSARTEKQFQDVCLTSPEKSGNLHSLFEPAGEDHKTSQVDLGNSDMQTSLRWSPQQSGGMSGTKHNISIPQTNSNLSLNKNPEKQKANTPSDSFINKTFLLKKKISPLDANCSISKTYIVKSKISPVSLTSTPQTNNELSLNKNPENQKASTPSDSLIGKTFQLKQKISPLDASSSISKTYFMKGKVSPVSLTSTALSMPIVETADAPGQRRSASFGPSPGHTAQLSCTDSNNVISVVHTNKKNVSQVPKKTSSRTPKKVTQEEAITTTVEKPTAKKRKLTPTSVVSNVKNSSGKRMRTIAPAMYEGVSPRKLFPRKDKINQGRNSPLPSPGSSVDSPEPTKNNINSDIVIPMKVRRTKRQLNLGLSSSPVQHIYMNKQSLGHSNAGRSGSLLGDASQVGGNVAPAQQKTGDSSGQVLRRSPRKVCQPYKLTM